MCQCDILWPPGRAFASPSIPVNAYQAAGVVADPRLPFRLRNGRRPHSQNDVATATIPAVVHVESAGSELNPEHADVAKWTKPMPLGPCEVTERGSGR